MVLSGHCKQLRPRQDRGLWEGVRGCPVVPRLSHPQKYKAVAAVAFSVAWALFASRCLAVL